VIGCPVLVNMGVALLLAFRWVFMSFSSITPTSWLVAAFYCD